MHFIYVYFAFDSIKVEERVFCACGLMLYEVKRNQTNSKVLSFSVWFECEWNMHN